MGQAGAERRRAWGPTRGLCAGRAQPWYSALRQTVGGCRRRHTGALEQKAHFGYACRRVTSDQGDQAAV
jgi:hypothetical protein